VFSNEHVG